MHQRLKLRAISAEDLAVISAMVQDAVVRVADMAYDDRHHRFALLMNRFCWEKLAAGAPAGEYPAERVRAGLHFDGVLKAECRAIPRHDSDAVLELLAIEWHPMDDGNGHILLDFAGEATVRLVVECLEAHLADMSDSWKARRIPLHQID